MKKTWDYDRLSKILQETHADELKTSSNTVRINWQTFNNYYPEYADNLLAYPRETISHLQLTVKRLSIQKRIPHIILTNTPLTPIRDIHSTQREELITFEGTVKKTRKVFNQITEAVWNCKICKHPVSIKLKYDDRIQAPKMQCTECGRKTKFVLNTKQSTFEDVQLFTVQEPLDKVKRGFQPVEINCYLKNNLIQTVKPGDKIRVTGVIELRNKSGKNMFTEYCTVHHLEFIERDFEDIKITPQEKKDIIDLSHQDNLISKLSSQIVPSMHSNEMLKKALLLQLASSDKVIFPDGSSQRGDIHILLIGDPGIGKSQILKGVTQLAPRGIFTSGKSSSGAGLTATAVKDIDDSWTLEAGAMVLADGGQVCIDEFDKMNESDRSAIHEALEQQTISVSKAGMNTTLHSECSVLAAANPKLGNFDAYNKKIKDQITLTSTLLSRFDLIFLLFDTHDEDMDAMIADQILNSQLNVETSMNHDFIRKYISYARNEIHPTMSEEANDRIKSFYQEWRKFTEYSTTPVTARQLLALVRLAKACARIRLSDTVTVEDAEVAIELEKYCINQGEYQINDGTIMNVQNKEDKKMHETMMEVMENLKEDFNNEIPTRFCIRDLKNATGKDSDYVQRWLYQMEREEKFVFNQNSGTWSVL